MEGCGSSGFWVSLKLSSPSPTVAMPPTGELTLLQLPGLVLRGCELVSEEKGSRLRKLRSLESDRSRLKFQLSDFLHLPNN